jgi:hypothetical protein
VRDHAHIGETDAPKQPEQLPSDPGVGHRRIEDLGDPTRQGRVWCVHHGLIGVEVKGQHEAVATDDRVQRAAPADEQGRGPQAAGLHGPDRRRHAEDGRPRRGREQHEPGRSRLGQGEPDTHSRFYFVRHAGNGTASTDVTTTFTVNVPDGTYTPSVRLNGRDFKILATGYDLERQRLVYSTSEIYTHMQAGDRHLALLHGRKGESGETVPRYASEPHVDVLEGSVDSSWDADRGDLRSATSTTDPRECSSAAAAARRSSCCSPDSDTASTFWRVDTDRGPALGSESARAAEAPGRASAPPWRSERLPGVGPDDRGSSMRPYGHGP